MNQLAEQQDRVLERLATHGVQGDCGPQLNERSDPEYWLNQEGRQNRNLPMRTRKAKPYPTMN